MLAQCSVAHQRLHKHLPAPFVPITYFCTIETHAKQKCCRTSLSNTAKARKKKKSIHDSCTSLENPRHSVGPSTAPTHVLSCTIEERGCRRSKKKKQRFAQCRHCIEMSIHFFFFFLFNLVKREAEH